MQSMGKKTERLRIAVSEELLREVRALADLECRDLEDQARWMLMYALSHIRGNRGNGQMEKHADISGHAVPRQNLSEDRSGHSVPNRATQERFANMTGPESVTVKKRRAG